MASTEALEAQLLARLQEERPLEAEEEAFCRQPGCLDRYLRARNGSVPKAAAMLRGTLDWRRTFGVASLGPVEFPTPIASGRMHVAGLDAAGRPVIVVRKRADRVAADAAGHARYLRFLVYSLETAVRAMGAGQEQWVLVFDMAGYTRANSPPLSVTLQTLRIFANHYPERLAAVHFVDAPTAFSLLFGAIKPFLDPVTGAKIFFHRSQDIKQQQQQAAAAAAPAAPASPAGDVPAEGPVTAAVRAATATATVTAAPPSSAASNMAAYWPFYLATYSEPACRELLARLWGGGGSAGGAAPVAC